MSVQRTIPFPYADQFAAVAPTLPGGGVPWLREAREAAIERFTRQGLPTPRTERWKYTNLNPLLKHAFTPATAVADGIAARDPGFLFVNGVLRHGDRAEALPAGLSLRSLQQVLDEEPELLAAHVGTLARSQDEPLVALNTAFMSGGYVLRVGRGVTSDKPVPLVFATEAAQTPTATHPRNLVIAEAGSRVVLIERHTGPAAGVTWANPVTEIVAEDGAVVEHYRFHEEGAEAFHVGLTAVRLGKEARYESLVMATGGALSRHEIRVALEGERAECRLLGGYLMRGRQHVDNTTEIVHAVPRTASRQIYKGVLDDHARGVFQGRVTVKPDAQKTDGHQLSRTLLLSDKAEMDTKPELEIHADDVKCSHGATAGELDDSALFYMRARGLDEAAARRLLTEAFFGDLAEAVTHPAARAAVETRVAAWLAGAFAEAA